MSIGANHVFTSLNKDSKALAADQRLVRLIAKKNKEGVYENANLSESLAVSVPRVTVEAVAYNIDRLLVHVARMCETVQDTLIRDYRIETGHFAVHDDVISLDKVIGYLDAQAAGDKVTVEYLQNWFMEEYADIAREWINTRLGGNVADDVLNKRVLAIRDVFSGFASNKYNPNEPTLKMIIAFAEGHDGRMAQYGARASELLNKKQAKENELTDALGF